MSCFDGAQHVASILASANLHRIRQEWDAAINDATEALKFEPKNPDIPSMLGEIYEQRGMLDEAAIWYQMALEADPNNAADKTRLDRVSRKMASKNARAKDSFSAFNKNTKIGALVMAGVLLIIVCVAIIVSRNKNGQSNLSAPPKPTTRVHAPEFPQNGPTAPITGSPSPNASMPSAGQPAKTSAALRTEGEAKVKNDLAQGQPAGVNVDDVIADPRQDVVVVTFSMPAATANKDNILSSAGAIARSVFASNTQAKFVTVRCLVTSGDSSPNRIVFVGDIARATSEPLGASPATASLEKAFTNQFWNIQTK
ncbi:MAG: hypothetical protein NT018_06235 [Armatimonadetes bacterium]|nr:hypothetical protein [Armatimonadota bacterium]